MLPTSVHGGVQLWYGTLQVGPYSAQPGLQPAIVFEAPAFDYTSLDSVPIVIAAQAKACAEAPPSEAALVYWTDRDTAPRRVSAQRMNGGPSSSSFRSRNERGRLLLLRCGLAD